MRAWATLGLVVLAACAPGAPQGPGAGQAPTAGVATTPLERLAALDLTLDGATWESRCQVELTTAEGDRVAHLEEEARGRFVDGGDFDVELVHRYDNRYQRGAVDSMRAVRAGEVLAVRRQQEPFARVAGLHGEAERYRQAGLGLFPALVAAVTGEARREGDRLRLVLIDPPPTPPAERPAPNDRAWLPALRASLSHVSGDGELSWPEGAGRPEAGHLRVTAALNGHPLSAECTLTVTPLPSGSRVEAPTPLVDLDRPRVQRDLDDFLENLLAAPPAPSR